MKPNLTFRNRELQARVRDSRHKFPNGIPRVGQSTNGHLPPGNNHQSTGDSILTLRGNSYTEEDVRRLAEINRARRDPDGPGSIGPNDEKAYNGNRETFSAHTRKSLETGHTLPECKNPEE